MPSIVPNYEYDIFISYRHNDNLDGWVTDFVQNLEKELRGTIKDAVTIYFDRNPHDGLLETHNVDKSLEGKLKCLIFIPIISQTYCDPKSFAWQHEFCAFNKLSQKDQFGRDIKLNNGNVASRILPVKIHDLDHEDQAALENEIGGVLRAIEFIYKEAGVNRPLKSTDSKADNQNKTDYRNQVNKVANAIKERVSALKPVSGFRKLTDAKAMESDGATSFRTSRLAWSIAICMVIAASFAAYYFFDRRTSTLNASQSSLAIIPFRNNTGDESKNLYGVGIASEVSTQMGLTRQFDFVSSLQATVQYQQSNDPPVKIGKELGVTHILSGMYQTAGDNIQVNVELIDAETGKVLWNFSFRTQYEDIFQLQSSIASKVMDRFAIDYSGKNEPPTKNLDAYYHYRKGWEIVINTTRPRDHLEAIPYFKKAIQLDSGYLAPWVDLIEVLTLQIRLGNDSINIKEVDAYMKYVEKHFPESWEKWNIKANYQYIILGDYDGALEMFLKVLDEYPENTNHSVSSIYRRKLELEKAVSVSLKQIKQLPNSAIFWGELRLALRLNGSKEAELKIAEKIYQLNPTLIQELYTSRLRQNSLHELPESIKKARGNRFKADLLLQKKDYPALQVLADIDTSMTESEYVYYKAIGHFLMLQDDSAKFYANRFLKTAREGSQLLDMYGILRKEKDWADYQLKNSAYINMDVDLQMQWERKREKLSYYALSLEYEMATRLLKEMNRDYPQVGYYHWLDVPIFNRIKTEYAPFVAAINQLHYPRKISVAIPLQ